MNSTPSRFTLFVLLAATALAQDAGRMDQIVRSYVTNKQFMGAALVARGDEVLFSKAYGSANLEWNIPNTPDTKFRLGSITKQFTAASILLLEERGKLSTDDLVKKHLPDAPPAWDKITIFHVLTHTAGIPNFTSFPDYAKLKLSPTTAAERVELLRDKPLEFEPGERYAYSNSGYVLLTHLIEKLSGQGYERFLRENIFAPLGMKDSGFDSNTAILPKRAAGYAPGRGGPQHAPYIDMTVPQGAGSLYSTTEDLLKWERGLFGGKVLQPASLAKMTQPFKANYAMGLQVMTAGKRKTIQHNGAIEGFNTDLRYFPDTQVTVVVLANLPGPAAGQIAGQLVMLAHGEDVKLTSERTETIVDPKVLSRYVGAYALGPGMVITLEGNQLISKLGAQGPVPIFPESETLFFAKVVDAQIEFPATETEGRASQMILHQNGRDQVARRLDDAAAQKLLDHAAAIALRVKAQKPAEGSEATLRKNIEDLRSGQPDYGAMSPGLANITRQQLPMLQAMIVKLGALRSLSFKEVGPGGMDVYEAKYENGAQDWRIILSADGKMEAVGVGPPR